MISCRLSQLEDRCRERGYSIDAAMACVVSRSGEFITVDETHSAYPHARNGLGDIVAAGLAGMGITEERVSKAIGKPCGCKKRKEWLNRVGRVIGIGQEAASAEKPVDDQPA